MTEPKFKGGAIHHSRGDHRDWYSYVAVKDREGGMPPVFGFDGRGLSVFVVGRPPGSALFARAVARRK